MVLVNIIPKPFIPIKGKYHPSRTIYQNHLFPSKVNITLPEHYTKTMGINGFGIMCWEGDIFL
jgi:hypothetical protein